MDEFEALVGCCLANTRVNMTQTGDPNATCEVQQSLAILVYDIRALAFGHDPAFDAAETLRDMVNAKPVQFV
jgi:hypothetical protein